VDTSTGKLRGGVTNEQLDEAPVISDKLEINKSEIKQFDTSSLG